MHYTLEHRLTVHCTTSNPNRFR